MDLEGLRDHAQAMLNSIVADLSDRITVLARGEVLAEGDYEAVANDPRVIKPESDDIVAAVRKNGVPVEYVVFPDEGHGFSKRKNQIEAYGRIRAFLDKYLKGAA